MSGASITFNNPAQENVESLNRLPPLREELDLYPGAPTIDGTPTWVIQDPVAHRFFQLGWLEFELLSRWHLGNVESVLDDLHAAGKLRANVDQVVELAEFLAANNLFQSRGREAMQRFKEHASLLGRRDLMWLLKNYLFIRIPLLNPDRFLTRSLPWVQWMGTTAFLVTVVGSGLLGIFLVQRQWQGFLSSFPYFYNLQGAILLGSALIFSKIAHEFGHAWSAKNFGCKVPSIGVAFLVMWPVLYTDATDTWRLTSRRQRIIIGAAGMLTELAIAAFATLAWTFMADGPLRSALFLLATTTWIVTLLVNLNPFMRFDGYYLLSDLLGVPNLQERAFALARWRMREWMFGLEEEIPERFPARTQKLLLIYAFGTWIYRFFLFLGIALLVYHFFFKLLGIFLMVVELAWFIGRPILNEFTAWFEYRHHLQWNFKTGRLILLILLTGLLLFYPWQRDISAPALWKAAGFSQIYMPTKARVDEILVGPGTMVAAGQTLFQLSSPDLEFAITQGELELGMLDSQISAQNFNAELRQRSRVLLEEQEAAVTRQRARLLEQEKLKVVSPIAGQVRDLIEPLSPSDWLGENELLAVVVATENAQIDAWVAEADMNTLRVAATGRFFPDDLQKPSFPITLTRIDAASSRQLSEPMLASDYGGEIATRLDQDGRLIPVNPVYHVLAEADTLPAPQQVVRGNVRLEASRESLAVRLWRTTVSVLIQESSF